MQSMAKMLFNIHHSLSMVTSKIVDQRGSHYYAAGESGAAGMDPILIARNSLDLHRAQ
jgi:hypothetical protein